MLTDPTCVANNCTTLIDLVFAASLSQVNFCSTSYSTFWNSDHFGLQLRVSVLTTKSLTKAPPRNVWQCSQGAFDPLAVLLDDLSIGILLLIIMMSTQAVPGGRIFFCFLMQ